MAKEDLVKSLNNLLADVFALYVRAHGFHWNVEGEDFSQYHELFQTIYEDVYGSIDPIAENVRKLDGKTPTSLSQLSDLSDLSETGIDATAPGALAKALLEMNDKVLEGLNAAFKAATDENEQGIANFLSERIDMHQKWRWQLSASLSGASDEGNNMTEKTAADDVLDAENDECRNCGTTDAERNIEGGLCERCFRSMPMDEFVTPGTWEPAEDETKQSSVKTAINTSTTCAVCGSSLEDQDAFYCYDEVHGTPCPMPCAVCKDECDTNTPAICSSCWPKGAIGGLTHTSSLKTALENPFDGYGRPFSEDPLNPNVDPAYYGDNPASDVKPYAGPNSYSINTTTPYMPPNSGMEDPGQNVGPYSPPGYEEEAAELGLVQAAANADVCDECDNPLGDEEGDGWRWLDCDDCKRQGITCDEKICTECGADVDDTPVRRASVVTSSYETWNSETQWFDGTSESIYRRIASAREIQKTADASTANLIEEQVKVLEKVANEFEDSSLAEYMTSVPGGTVAMEYDDLMDGGLVDVASFISTEAHKYITEVNTYDWERFASDAPRMWVTAKAQSNPGVLAHEGSTREAAIDYVKSKTMVLMDPSLRADIIDNFVSDVEVERRSYVAAREKTAQAESERKAEFERQQRARVAAELNELEYGDDNLFPGQTTVGTNDPFDFGADDGTALYAEAKKVAEAHVNRNWEAFCTEGARDWFYSNDAGKNSMYRHADTTRHAAKQYVEDETTLVKDPAMKSEIRRAFLSSVDFLREEWLEKQASLEEEPEDIDVLSQYYDDETLW